MTAEWLEAVAPSRERDLLLGIIDSVANTSDLGVLAARVAALVVSATATDVCFVHVLDDDGRRLTLTGATPPFDRYVGEVSLPLGEGVSGWVAAHRRPVVIVDDKRADRRYRFIPQLRGDEFASMASVPMVSRPAGLAGVLNVHTRQRRDFRPADVDLLTGIGRLVAGAVHSARLHRRLETRQREHEQLAADMVALQERERRRIAADIHDGVSQRIVSLLFHLSAGAEALGGDCDSFVAEQITATRMLADLALREAKAAVDGLRPPLLDDLGLADALLSLARSVPGLTVDVGIDPCGLPDHLQVTVYRIAQEALQNVAKHAAARASAIEVRCRGEEVLLRIVDDGEGFDLADRSDRGFGLASMKERAELVGGRLVVATGPGRGTAIEVTLPRGRQPQPG